MSDERRANVRRNGDLVLTYFNNVKFAKALPPLTFVLSLVGVMSLVLQVVQLQGWQAKSPAAWIRETNVRIDTGLAQVSLKAHNEVQGLRAYADSEFNQLHRADSVFAADRERRVQESRDMRRMLEDVALVTCFNSPAQGTPRDNQRMAQAICARYLSSRNVMAQP